MSAICGIIRWDGSPVEAGALDRMVEAQRYRGSDREGRWVRGSAALGHLALHTTPEAVREQQPLTDEAAGLVLIADARVDNRQELIARLRRSGRLTAGDPTDADLILAAFQEWGEDCARQILGDFAFVVWNWRAQEVHCFRDPIGLRQLVYCTTGNQFAFATTSGALVRAGLVGKDINRPLLAELLQGTYSQWSHGTAYRAVHRVPPAHHLRVSAAGLREQAYWTLCPQAELRGLQDEEYVERFRAVFHEAVDARRRTQAPLAVMMSGGLDSSSVACTLENLGTDSPGERRAYSLRFERTPGADESDYQAAVARVCPGMVNIPVPADDQWGLREFGAEHGFPFDEPEIEINRALIQAPMQAAGRDGCRVVLTGHAGDEVLGGRPYYEPAMLADVGLRYVPGELPHFVRYSRKPAAWILPYTYLRPYLPEDLVAAMRKLLKGTGYLGPEGGDSSRMDPEVRLDSRSARSVYHRLTRGFYRAQLFNLDRLSAYSGVELRCPFLDRRVVELLISMPPRMRFREGWSKYVLREAMRGILPEEVRRRTTHGAFAEIWHRGLRERERHRIEAWLVNSRTAQLGLCDGDAVRASWEQYWQKDTSVPVLPLSGFLYVESWLRYLEQS